MISSGAWPSDTGTLSYLGMLMFSYFWFVLVDLVFPYLSVEMVCEKSHEASTCLVILLVFVVLLASVFTCFTLLSIELILFSVLGLRVPRV